MKKKGMSQVLSLIVAAAVLMMAALTVIFLTSSSLGDFGSQVRGSSCINQIQTQCSAQGNAGSVDAPGSCFTEGGAPTQSFADSQYTGSQGGSVSCDP
jgi:flagellar basal body-associated protein FliL